MLNPLAVFDVSLLPARHILQMLRIDQAGLDLPLFEDLEQRNPPQCGSDIALRRLSQSGPTFGQNSGVNPAIHFAPQCPVLALRMSWLCLGEATTFSSVGLVREPTLV